MLKQYPYLIAEIGINHNGDMQIVKKLIDATFACGWDCVKFQKRTPKICVPIDQKFVIKDTPWGRMTYLEYKERIEFGKTEFDFIDNYCKDKPIDWSSSVWDLPSLDFILNYDVPFIKIPSAKLTEYELLTVAAQSGKKIILSTGMSTLDEIDVAVEILRIHAKEFVLMHTNSTYPSFCEEVNLEVIETLKNRYGCLVGYSGHEYGLEPTVVAASMGVPIIERHITLDHNMWGTDQKASLEIEAMFTLKNRVRDACDSVGDGIKRITENEEIVRNKLRGK
jgi:N-acetylneuraminate synthase